VGSPVVHYLGRAGGLTLTPADAVGTCGTSRFCPHNCPRKIGGRLEPQRKADVVRVCLVGVAGFAFVVVLH
jgi:hypothetical protein